MGSSRKVPGSERRRFPLFARALMTCEKGKREMLNGFGFYEPRDDLFARPWTQKGTIVLGEVSRACEEITSFSLRGIFAVV